MDNNKIYGNHNCMMNITEIEKIVLLSMNERLYRIGAITKDEKERIENEINLQEIELNREINML